ncbi:MAG: class I SAM-dependent methyltransferase [Marinirhabdus sp.]|nr:class I SAM-dependent methyltransferase [Marinirhabdus sp.]
MNDLIGRALLDFHNGNYSEDLITETNISEEDELPLPYLFRGFEDMPPLEQVALQHCRGSILDVGCGAGNHALWLQEQEHKVTAIDTSEGAIEVCKKRGVNNAQVCSLLNFSGQRFDTIVLLMNGTGIFETVSRTGVYLSHLKTLLRPNGQILIDSSDLQFMYDRNEDGSIWVPAKAYYGELEFTMTYKGETSASFPWLYLDPRLFERLAEENGFNFNIVEHGDHYDYLAQLTVA